MDYLQYVIIGIGAFLSGTIQAVSGFGVVLILMMLLPFFYPMNLSVGISSSASLTGNIFMTISYWKKLDWKKILPPAIINIVISGLATFFADDIDQGMVKKGFGVFLILLSLYYLFAPKKKEKKPMPPLVQWGLCLVASLCMAFFGVGGPLMSIYFMNLTASPEEYLGSIQAYFLLCGITNTVVRFASGTLGLAQLPVILVCLVCVLTGSALGKRLVHKMDADKIRTITYVMVGIAGIVNVIK